ADQRSDNPRAAFFVEVLWRLSPQAALERAIEDRGLVDLGKDFRDRGLRGCTLNPELADFLQHARAAAMPDGAFEPGRRQRHALVVQRPVLLEATDRIVDVVWLELAALEAGAEL